MRKNLYKELYLLEDVHWWNKSKRRTSLKLLNNFNKIRKPKILDIGCGAGKNIEDLEKIGETWGIDFSKDAIYYCKKRGLKNVKLGSADATKFPANLFDIVTLYDVLEHTDDAKTLKEIKRILKPGGLLLITVPAFQQLWSQWDVILHHHRRYTKKTLQNVLEKNSFSPLRMSYMYAFLFVPSYFVRKIKSKFFKDNYPSDFKMNAPFLNWLLFNISAAESYFVIRGYSLFGTSLICIAKKNEK